MKDSKDNQNQQKETKRHAWQPMSDPHQATPVNQSALVGKNPFLVQRKVETPVVQKVAPVAIFLWAVGRYAAQKFAQGAVIELAMQALFEFVLEGRVDFTDPDKYIDAAWEGIKEIFGGGKHVGAVVDGLNALVSEYRKNPKMTPAQGLKAFAWGMGQSYLFDYIAGKLGKKLTNPSVIQKVKSGLAKIGITGPKVDAFFDKYIKTEAKSSPLPQTTAKTNPTPVKTVAPTKTKTTSHAPVKTGKTVTQVPVKKVVPLTYTPVKKVNHNPTTTPNTHKVETVDANVNKVETVDANTHKTETTEHLDDVKKEASAQGGGNGGKDGNGGGKDGGHDGKDDGHHDKDGDNGGKKEPEAKKLEDRLSEHAEIKKHFDSFDVETRKLFEADFSSVDDVVLKMMNQNPEVIEFWLKNRNKLRHETKPYQGHRERGTDDSPDKSATSSLKIEDVEKSMVGKDKELVEKVNKEKIDAKSECVAGVYHQDIDDSIKMGQNKQGKLIDDDSLPEWGTSEKWAAKNKAYRELLETMGTTELKQLAQYLNMIRLDALINNNNKKLDFKNDLWYKLLNVDLNINLDKIEASLHHSLSPEQKAEALHKAMQEAEAYWMKAMRTKIVFAGKAGSHSEVIALNQLIEMMRQKGNIDFSIEKLRMYVRDKHGLNKCRCPNCYFMTVDKVTMVSND